MNEVRAEIVINVSANKVWKILVDFPRYQEWNPFVRRVTGTAKIGEKLKVYVKPENGRGMQFTATVIKLEPNKELRWVGCLFFPGLLDGEHIFIIQPLARNKVRFVHSERFSGALSFIGGRNPNTKRGLNGMNVALKKLVEK